MNNKIQEGFVSPLKNKYPSVRIMIYDIGKDTDKFYYDKDSLLIKIASENQKTENDVNIQKDTIKFLTDHINEQFVNHESLYMNSLKDKALDTVNTFKQLMVEFHCQDKNVKKHKEVLLKDLEEKIKIIKEKSINEYKTEIFNTTILYDIIEKIFKEIKDENDIHVQNEIFRLIDNFLTNKSKTLVDVLSEHLTLHGKDELLSNEYTNSSKDLIMGFREENKEFLQSKITNIPWWMSFPIYSFINSALGKPLLFSNVNKRISFCNFSRGEWIEGEAVVKFFDDLLKRMPKFVSLLGFNKQTKTYFGNSNDLYRQAENLVESLNKNL